MGTLRGHLLAGLRYFRGMDDVQENLLFFRRVVVFNYFKRFCYKGWFRSVNKQGVTLVNGVACSLKGMENVPDKFSPFRNLLLPLQLRNISFCFFSIFGVL
jgi:hypothetical protein